MDKRVRRNLRTVFNEHPVAWRRRSKYTVCRGPIKEELIALKVSFRRGSGILTGCSGADSLANLRLLTVVQCIRGQMVLALISLNSL